MSLVSILVLQEVLECLDLCVNGPADGLSALSEEFIEASSAVSNGSLKCSALSSAVGIASGED